MNNYKEGDMVLFTHKTSSQKTLKGMIQKVVPSGDNSQNHYNILCQELQCELFISGDDIIDYAY